MARKRTNSGRAQEPAEPYAVRTAEVVQLPGALLDLVEEQMKSLNEKATRVSQALSRARIPHAVVGGLAIAAHIKVVNSSAVRTTQDLDVLLNKDDLSSAGDQLEPLGYKYRKVMGIHIFARKGEKFEDAVHIVLSGDKVRKEYLHPAPDLPSKPDFVSPDGFVCLDLTRLLTMKLTSFRLKDQVHVQDLLLVGLISKKIERALPKDLQARLKQVRETTERERLG